MYYCLNIFGKLKLSAQQPVWASVCVIKKASDRATRCYTVHTNHRRTFGGSLSELSSQCTEPLQGNTQCLSNCGIEHICKKKNVVLKLLESFLKCGLFSLFPGIVQYKS